jgi:hypothetical protein
MNEKALLIRPFVSAFFLLVDTGVPHPEYEPDRL